MQAVTYTRYGSPDVLELRDAAMPTVGDDDVLIRVCAASTNPYDWHFMRGEPLLMRLMTGLRRPRETGLGVDVAGVVEAVGSGVPALQPGDAVFGTASGSFREYVCAPAEWLAAKPDGITFEQAAAVPIAGFTALQALRDTAALRSGERILVNGAAGGVGTFAVQIAAAIGAEVTGVCSTRNVALVRGLGAQQVVDYTRADFVDPARPYDVLLDMVGSRSLADCRRALTPHGRYVLVGSNDKGAWLGPLRRSLRARLLSPFVSQTLTGVMARRDQDDLRALAAMIVDGKVTPVIDRSYPLPATAEAIRYLEEGHARGKVVISIGDRR